MVSRCELILLSATLHVYNKTLHTGMKALHIASKHMLHESHMLGSFIICGMHLSAVWTLIVK